jgi:putative tryptophan/tyrosine transport system substrate-binding protein
MPQLFHTLVALSFLLMSSATVLAQQPKMFKIGFVSWFSPGVSRHAEQLRQGLRDFGYIEGKNLEFESYFTDGNREKTREVLRSLIDRGVDILVVAATPAIHIAKELAQNKIPIVMAPVADPVATGLVQSLAHPGGNLTGITMVGADLAGKRLELLREILPDLRTVAFLGSTRDPNTVTFMRGTKAAAEKLGIKLVEKMVDGPDAIDETIFKAMKSDGVQAVVVQPIFTGSQNKIVSMAMKEQLPAISDFLLFAEAGALVTYGVDDDGQVRRAAYYIDRILKGTSPADLPIEGPTSFKLGVNAATAKALGLTIPRSLLFRADLVVE